MIPAWLIQALVIAFIAAVIGAIGYFIKELMVSLASLTEAINGLKNSSDSNQATCKLKHEILSKWQEKVEHKLDMI